MLGGGRLQWPLSRSDRSVAMRKDLMEILACPLCKGPLELTVEKEKEAEVISGSLFCPKCSQRYPIVDSIPNLLPPELRE
jgi:uncharacterized protein YbaR (Trm112 family)